MSKAQETAPITSGTLRDQRIAIVVPDQMLRAGVLWGQGQASDAPPLNDKATKVLAALLWRPIRDYDHRNTLG